MLSSKRGFDGLRFGLNFAYTGRAHRNTRMWFSKELVCKMSQKIAIDLPAKVILARS